MERQHASDERLVKLLQDGDRGAFDEIWFRCQRPVYRFALHMSGSQAVADEVTQDTFLFLLQNPAGYSAKKGALTPFLLGVARNYVRHCLRRDLRELPLDDDESDDIPPMMSARDPFDEAARQQSIDAVWKALLRMPVHHREVVALCDLDEMTYAEAAEILGIPVGTVRSRLHRAHSDLSERLLEQRVSVGQRTGS